MSLLTGQVTEIRAEIQECAEQWLKARSSLRAPARRALAKLTPSLLHKLQQCWISLNIGHNFQQAHIPYRIEKVGNQEVATELL